MSDSSHECLKMNLFEGKVKDLCHGQLVSWATHLMGNSSHGQLVSWATCLMGNSSHECLRIYFLINTVITMTHFVIVITVICMIIKKGCIG